MIHLAAIEGSMERVRHLSTWKSGIQTRASISPWSPATPLDFAALGGHEHLTRYLVESGAGLVRKAERDITLLHFAIAGGNLDTVKYALSLGFDINARNGHGETFLHYAAREGSPVIVKYLIERGAEVNAKAVNGSGVMHFAAAGGDLEIVRQLRILGVSLNSKTRDGHTPLHYAAMFGTVPAVQYLIREGLSPWDTSADGLTPFHCSVLGRNHFVPNYLIMKFLIEPPPDTPEGTIRESSLIIVRDRKGRGLLHYCAYLEDPAIARYLVNYGIDVNMKDNDGLKAADYARKTRNEELLRILASSPRKPSCMGQKFHGANI